MDELTNNDEQGVAHKANQLEQYLTFFANDEILGIAINDIKEIIEINNITKVPMTPDYIRGVINLRGNVVPVIDLSARLGRNVSIINKRSCIVLVEVENKGSCQPLGMLVDSVKEILEIPDQNIQDTPSFGVDIRLDFIKAMGRINDEFMIILDVERVLSIEELAELDLINNIPPSSIKEPV